MDKIKQKKGKKQLLIYLLLLITTLISSGGIIYLYLRFSPGEELTLKEGTKLIPEKALMGAFISTNEENWSQLEKIKNQQTQKFLSTTIKKIPQEIFGETNINYQENIEPWLGNMMLAFLPSVNNDYELLGVFGIKNKLKALEFANQIRQDKNYQFKIGNYQGFTIIETTNNINKKSLNIAFIDNKLIVAKQRKIIELAIDTFQGMPSFEVHNLEQNISAKNTVISLYIPDYLRIVKEQIYDSSLSQKIPATTIKKIGAVQSIVMGLGIEKNALHLQTIAKINNQIIKSKFTPKNPDIINKIPSETMLLLTGNELNKNWLRISEQAQEIPEFNYSLLDLKKFFKMLNLDLDREIFGWLDGEFALAITPSETGLFNNFAGLNIAGSLILETSDQDTALSTIDKVEKLAEKTDLIEVNTEKKGSQIVTEWTTFPDEIVLSYTWENEKTFLMTLGSPINKLTNITPNQSLATNPNFEQITANLPALNLGYFYLDIPKIINILNNFPLTKNQPLPPEINNTLNAFEGIVLTATMINDTTGQIDLILAFKEN